MTLFLLASSASVAASAARAQPQSPQPGESTDPTDGVYREALDAFARGEYERAATLFDAVARATNDAQRRAAALDLAAQARARHASAVSQPSGETPATQLTEPPRPQQQPQRAPQPDSAPTAQVDVAASHPIAQLVDIVSPRTVLLGSSLALGLTSWGIAAAMLVIDDDPDEGGARAVGMYLLTASAAFFVPFLATLNVELEWGPVQYAVDFGIRGIGHGLALDYVMHGEWEPRRTWIMQGAFSLLGYAGSYALASELGLSRAHAAATSSGHDVTIGATLALTGLVHPDLYDTSPRTVVGLAQLGGLAGIGLGHLYDAAARPTWADVHFVWSMGVAGVLFTGGLLIAASADDARVVSATLLAGGAGGLVAGHLLNEPYDLGTAGVMLMNLGQVAGALLGLGVGLVAGGGPEVVSVGMGTGQLGGLLLTWHVLDKPLRQPSSSEQRGAAHRDVELSWSPWVDRNGRAGGLALSGSF
ncbi:MAG: hypothetical protein NZ898_12790 [Myxococcota bacterium]|nr:hypothetical protein [Myxococcota bacterium]MDW8361026.1 hypothetical protein [Myxococcales bacterium]